MAVSAPERIAAFFEAKTPERWVDEACGRLPELLLDHANCELKAASTALALIYRYPERRALAEILDDMAAPKQMARLLQGDDFKQAASAILGKDKA